MQQRAWARTNCPAARPFKYASRAGERPRCPYEDADVEVPTGSRQPERYITPTLACEAWRVEQERAQSSERQIYVEAKWLDINPPDIPDTCLAVVQRGYRCAESLPEPLRSQKMDYLRAMPQRLAARVKPGSAPWDGNMFCIGEGEALKAWRSDCPCFDVLLPTDQR